MAKIFENEKGFKIIEISRGEILDKLSEFGSIGICDDCGITANNGYYIAVLNKWFCKDCFTEWYGYAINYPEDREIEERNFECYKSIFEID